MFRISDLENQTAEIPQSYLAIIYIECKIKIIFQLKQLLDLRKVKPELINQDVLPIIISQNNNQQNDEVIQNIQKNEIKQQKLSAREKRLLKELEENN